MSAGLYELVMYTRTTPCPFVSLAKRVLDEHKVLYREIFIDKSMVYEGRVLGWTGFLSVPTLVVAGIGDDMPYTDPAPLEKDASPRGIDRGPMITEPGEEQLISWLRGHGFMTGRIGK
jgi:glutaredoxin